MGHIPLFYRIFFLYIDPLICLLSIYLFFFDHPTYILNGIPSSLSTPALQTPELPPLVQLLITGLGAYSLCIFTMQIFLLRQFSDAPDGINVRIWRIVLFSILLTDLGLIYGVYRVDAEGLLDVKGWTRGDWSNYGILGTVIAVRTAFLLGIGGVGKVD